jgi:hypothetical protein
VTGLNGFIDPTDPVFAPYDANLPSTYNLGTSGASAPPLGGVGQLLDVGVEGTGAQASAGATVAFANGETIGSVTLFNGSTAVTITSSAITTSSKIFTTLVNRAAVVAHCITALSAGSFTVTFSSAVAGGDDVLQFMIVNTSRQ